MIATALLPRLASPLLLLLAGCAGSAGEADPPAAHVDNPTTEAGLTTVRLSERAEQRIGIQTAVVERRAVRQRRTLGGELMPPPGSAFIVTAPRAATVLAPDTGQVPAAGARVNRGQPLLRLLILPSGSELVVAQARFDNAEAKAKRAERLLREGVASQSEVEDARAELASATAILTAARSRFAQTEGADPGAGLTSITLNAPESGIVQSLHFTPGQTVSDGAPLLEIVRPNPLWIRVPVYVGDLASVDRRAAATVVAAGDPPTAPRLDATPISGPQTADASISSADLFYRLDNSAGRFRPGERISVSIPLGQSSEQLVVPWSAILHDINGGTWVYESAGDHAYIRRRVEVAAVVDGFAALRRGPEPGTRIVTVGAAELFSTEFGTSH